MLASGASLCPGNLGDESLSPSVKLTFSGHTGKFTHSVKSLKRLSQQDHPCHDTKAVSELFLRVTEPPRRAYLVALMKYGGSGMVKTGILSYFGGKGVEMELSVASLSTRYPR